MKEEAFLMGTPPLLYLDEKGSENNYVVIVVLCLQQ